MGPDANSFARRLPAEPHSDVKLHPPDGPTAAEVWTAGQSETLLAAVRKARQADRASRPRFSLRELFAVVTVTSVGMAILRVLGPIWCAGISGQLSLAWLAWHAIWGSESRSRWAYLLGWSLFSVYLLSL